ncbi:VOC family protein [Pelagibacterium montanilacus]|uniref:VOC family protein n=1 Tax=Pelagibacterium montanilacus TaxID=2185280 RepID=UPI000F8CEEB8|nr:VOC family protein [Pelagibacterium montanilacus]
MDVHSIFLSINARDFAAQSDWWRRCIGRNWDREPMPSCHEWDLRDGVLFQVLDAPDAQDQTTITLLVPDLDAERARLAQSGIEVPDPSAIEGFDTLRYTEFFDPEGNTIGLLDGS